MYPIFTKLTAVSISLSSMFMQIDMQTAYKQNSVYASNIDTITQNNANSIFILNKNQENHYLLNLIDYSKTKVEDESKEPYSDYIDQSTILYNQTGLSAESVYLLASIPDSSTLKELYVEIDPFSFYGTNYDISASLSGLSSKNDYSYSRESTLSSYSDWCDEKDSIPFSIGNISESYYSYILNQYLVSHPQTKVTFCLPVYSIYYWVALSENGLLQDALTTYRQFAEDFCSFTNVTIVWPGCAEYIISNPDSFCEGIYYDASLSYTVAKHMYSREFILEKDTLIDQFSTFEKVIHSITNHPYPDLKGKSLAIFGDSINGNFTGDFTIEHYLEGMTDLDVYNYAVGGATAWSDETDKIYWCSVNNVTQAVVNHDFSTINASTLQFDSYETTPYDIQYDYIMLEYGFNDYFFNIPISNSEDRYDLCTFKGAYRTSIERLKKAYPNAKIMITTPNFTSMFENGTENMNGNGVLEDYVQAISELADEYDLTYIDVYHNPDWNEEHYLIYSHDGCHPNEYGRFLLANRYLNGILH